MHYLILNGKIIAANEPVLSPDNRAFRYGEGIFETIRYTPKGMPLWELHVERLTHGLATLGMQFPVHFFPDQLKSSIATLVQKNGHGPHARIRLTFYNGDGGLWEEPSTFYYIIQSWPLTAPAFNVNGLDIGVYPQAHKSCDILSNLKSNNYLLYALAASYARKQKWNDILVLNEYRRIADSTIANLFFIKKGIVYTPALSEACVAGTLRRYLLEKLPLLGYKVIEGSFTAADLHTADEVFLTNAIQGIRWVKQFEEKQYLPRMTKALYKDLIIPLFA